MVLILVADIIELFIRQRVDRDIVSSSPEFSHNIGGKHFGTADSHIQVKVLDFHQSKQ